MKKQPAIFKVLFIYFLLLGVGVPARQASSNSHQSPPVKEITSDLWRELQDGNLRFSKGKPQAREFVERRKKLVKGQEPKFIVLGCSDSRVSPELLFDKNIGELFVVRTAGNIADLIALGSIEYAIEHLGAKVIVVLGHEKCGAVAAACDGGTMPTLNLDAIVKKIKPAIGELKMRFSGDQLKSLAVRANIYQSSNDLVKNSPIIKEAVEKKSVQIINGIYLLQSGEVERLP